jgi:hypothetical protein
MKLLSLLAVTIKPKDSISCAWSKTLTKFHFCVYGRIDAGDDVEAMGYLNSKLSEDEVKEDDS